MNAQQLKNAILQEAIEGRLEPQDPNDEPASALLARIRKEKERLVKEGKLRKKDLIETPISEEEIPFEIPDSWEWVRLTDITELIEDCPHSTAKDEGKGYPLVRTPNVGFGKLLLEGVHRVSESVYNKRNERAIPQAYDLIYAREATAGNVAVIEEGQKVCLGQRTVLVRPMQNRIDSYWLAYFILSPYSYSSLVGKSTGTTVAHVNLSDFRPFVLPLPPIAEQHRIVAKIEELLPKVEEYGKAQDALNKLNAELPERLKKSILQEAIEGRLVPQDPNDEPASVLLAKIRKEKEQLVKEGKLKKKDLIETPITEDEIPFEIPESWEWVRLGNLVSNQTGLSYNKGDLEKKVDNPIRVLRGGNIQNGSWCTKVDDVMIAPEYVKKPNLTLQKNTFITPAVTSLEHLGKTALIEEDHSDIVAGGFVLYLLPFYRDDIFSKYLSYYFQSAYYNAYCQSIANKSGQAFWNLSRQKLMELVLPIPPLAEQQRIVEKLEQMLGEIDKLKQ